MKIPKLAFSKKTIGILAVITAAAAGAYGYYEANKPTEVAVVHPALMAIDERTEETGSIRYEQMRDIYADRSGKVTEVLKDLGETVAFGEVLLRMDGEANALQLKDAQAKIDAAKAQLEGTKAGSFADELDALSLQIAEAKRQEALAAEYLADAESLYESGALSEADYKAAKAQRDQAAAQLRALNLSYSQLSKGAQAYQRKLGQAQLDQALSYRDQLLYEQSLLQTVSPLAGVLMARQVDAGAFVMAGSVLMTVGDPGGVQVEADILADEIDGLSVGDAVEMTANYLPGQQISGQVVKLAPAAKETASSLGILQKRLPITVQVTSHQEALKPGLPIELSIIKASKAQALCVPSSAVLEDESGSYVLLAENGVVSRRAVTLGLKAELWVEVLSGLSEADAVIQSPEDSLSIGQKIIFEN